MDQLKRQQNERKFGSWEDLQGGGRRYWYEVMGRQGWRARYVKVVSADEITLQFYQEIYNRKEYLWRFMKNIHWILVTRLWIEVRLA